MSFEDALNYVQARRTRVAPNFGFLGQLWALSEMVKNKSWPVHRSSLTEDSCIGKNSSSSSSSSLPSQE